MGLLGSLDVSKGSRPFIKSSSESYPKPQDPSKHFSNCTPDKSDANKPSTPKKGFQEELARSQGQAPSTAELLCIEKGGEGLASPNTHPPV